MNPNDISPNNPLSRVTQTSSANQESRSERTIHDLAHDPNDLENRVNNLAATQWLQPQYLITQQRAMLDFHEAGRPLQPLENGTLSAGEQAAEERVTPRQRYRNRPLDEVDIMFNLFQPLNFHMGFSTTQSHQSRSRPQIHRFASLPQEELQARRQNQANGALISTQERLQLRNFIAQVMNYRTIPRFTDPLEHRRIEEGAVASILQESSSLSHGQVVHFRLQSNLMRSNPTDDSSEPFSDRSQPSQSDLLTAALRYLNSISNGTLTREQHETLQQSYLDRPRDEMDRDFTSEPLNFPTDHPSQQLQLTLHRKDLKDQPLRLFHQLTDRILNDTPSSLQIHFVGESGYDATGLRRDFISELFIHLPLKETTLLQQVGNSGMVRPTMSGNRDPIVIEEEKNFFHRLGYLLQFCLKSCMEQEGDGLLIGPFFEESFYETLICFDDSIAHNPILPDGYFLDRRELLIDAYKIHIAANDSTEERYLHQLNATFAPYLKPSEEIPDEQLHPLLELVTIYDDPPATIKPDELTTIRAHLPALQKILREELERAINEKVERTFTAIHAIAHGMAQLSHHYLPWKRIAKINNMAALIQGSLTPTKIIQKLIFTNPNHPNRAFLTRWIENAGGPTLQQFLQFTTGSRALGSRSITINHQYNGQCAIAHSCERSLNLPIHDFKGDYDRFKERFEFSIREGLTAFNLV